LRNWQDDPTRRSTHDTMHDGNGPSGSKNRNNAEQPQTNCITQTESSHRGLTTGVTKKTRGTTSVAYAHHFIGQSGSDPQSRLVIDHSDKSSTSCAFASGSQWFSLAKQISCHRNRTSTEPVNA
jgi:hypothetical protein